MTVIFALLAGLAVSGATGRASPPCPGRVVRTCADGARFEVLRADTYDHTLFSIMGSKDGVKDIAACARLCEAAAGCTCAWYSSHPPGACAWRADSCATSELYVDAKPTALRYGLIAMCPRAG